MEYIKKRDEAIKGDKKEKWGGKNFIWNHFTALIILASFPFFNQLLANLYLLTSA